MPLDPSYAGHVYPPSEIYEVGRAKIKEFAEAIGDDDPVYRDVAAARAAGHPDVVAPPTFTTILFGRYSLESITNDPELGLNYDRLVHGDMNFTFTRPVFAGDRLRVTTHITEIATRLGNDFLTLRADIGTADGAPVVSALSQLVVRAES